MNWNKSRLEREILKYETSVKMGKDILEVVKSFEHHAQVNKRFIDKLEGLGYHAYIQRDNFSTTISCHSREGDYSERAQFRYYVSHCIQKSPLTWDGIKECLEQHRYAKRLEELKEMVKSVDQEREDLKKLLLYAKEKKFTCFDSYKWIFAMEASLRDSKE
jgi:hypothetical protein